MTPLPPRPYRTTSYALPTSPLAYAQRIPLADGAELATFVYGPQGKGLEELMCTAPVLALHGNGGSHAGFAAVIERLVTAGCAVVAFDSRGQGQSTRGTLPLSYEQFAEDAIAVLDKLGIARAHIVGHSDGGIEALLLARDHADRVASIVAGGANLTPEGVIDEWDTPASAAAGQRWAAWIQDTELPPTIDPTLLPSAKNAALDAELLQLMLDEPHIDPASLGSISYPSCVLVGEHDCITHEETQAIADAITGARLVTVPGVGHGLPRNAPDSVALQVLTNILLAQ